RAATEPQQQTQTARARIEQIAVNLQGRIRSHGDARPITQNETRASSLGGFQDIVREQVKSFFDVNPVCAPPKHDVAGHFLDCACERLRRLRCLCYPGGRKCKPHDDASGKSPMCLNPHALVDLSYTLRLFPW